MSIPRIDLPFPTIFLLSSWNFSPGKPALSGDLYEQLRHRPFALTLPFASRDFSEASPRGLFVKAMPLETRSAHVEGCRGGQKRLKDCRGQVI